MTQETSQKPKPVRGQILGAWIATQRGSVPGEAQASLSQLQGFRVENILGRIDDYRARARSQTGYNPGLLLDRRATRRGEFLSALTKPRTIVLENPDPKQENPPTPPPAKSMFTCPWSDAGCTFTTDSPDALKAHVEIHTRAKIRTY